MCGVVVVGGGVSTSEDLDVGLFELKIETPVAPAQETVIYSCSFSKKMLVVTKIIYKKNSHLRSYQMRSQEFDLGGYKC